jgi:hypothetical protein
LVTDTSQVIKARGLICSTRPSAYNPYLDKIACRRLGEGLDPDAAAPAHFLSHHLPEGTTQVQTSGSLAQSSWTFPHPVITDGVASPNHQPSRQNGHRSSHTRQHTHPQSESAPTKLSVSQQMRQLK